MPFGICLCLSKRLDESRWFIVRKLVSPHVQIVLWGNTQNISKYKGISFWNCSKFWTENISPLHGDHRNVLSLQYFSSSNPRYRRCLYSRSHWPFFNRLYAFVHSDLLFEDLSAGSLKEHTFTFRWDFLVIKNEKTFEIQPWKTDSYNTNS